MQSKNTRPRDDLKILILGANSFIARYFIQRIANYSNLKISTFSRTSPSINQDAINKISNIFIGNFNEKCDLQEAMQDQDIVYNFIATSTPRETWDNPSLEVSNTLIPTLNFLEVAAQCKIKKIVFPSSGGTVYGTIQSSASETLPLHPMAPYGIMKATIEYFLEFFRVKNGIAYDIYRISNPYGRDQCYEKSGVGVLSRWISLISKGKAIEIYGDGSAVKDYIYIDDLCEFLTLSLKKNINSSDIYNASSGLGVSLNDIVEVLKKNLPIKFQVLYQNMESSDTQRIVLDNSKILREFPGYKLTSINSGIKEMLQCARLLD